MSVYVENSVIQQGPLNPGQILLQMLLRKREPAQKVRNALDAQPA